MTRAMSPYMRGASTLDRISAKVDVTPDGCWTWTAATDSSGYPLLGRPTISVHRWMCETFNGPIPATFQVDHVCRNIRCVNPEHLEAVTPAENMRRRSEAQTHCKWGHEFTPENTYLRGGHRACRACNARAQRNRRRRIRDGRSA